MTRREFLGFGLISTVVLNCRREKGFEIYLHNIAPKAHKLRQTLNWPVSKKIEVEIGIVGAGIAGMAAAASLRGRELLIIDPEPLVGGTAIARKSSQGLWLPQGAHYDLEYPDWFGSEGLQLLEKAGVVIYDGLSRRWRFVDEQYLVNASQETLCLEGEEYRNSVLPESPNSKAFSEFMSGFLGKVGLPSTHFELRKRLCKGSFSEFLKEKGFEPNSRLRQAIDYQMRDDYGADAQSITAWAGLVYYAARPQDCGLFASEKGNFYFIEKLNDFVEKKSLKLNSIVVGITDQQNGYLLTCADLNEQSLCLIRCRSVVYSAPKFTLSQVMPQIAAPFQIIEYAPWLCINLIIENIEGIEYYWQNEVLGFAPNLIGFVDSGAKNGYRVLTVYFCFDTEQRALLLDENLLQNQFLNQAIEAVEFFWDKPIRNLVKEVHIRPIGHGIAIPGPKMANLDLKTKLENFVLAGADTGRLPLLLDALDSGVQAAKSLTK